MDITGEHRIQAPLEVVWKTLNDPEVLKACINGCENMEKLSNTGFKAVVMAKVGPVQARFTGTVTLSEINPPLSYTITGNGQGGVAGFVKGIACVTLRDDDGTTVLRYEAKADVGGKLASVGNRLIHGVAAKTADSFFEKLAAWLG